MKYINKTNRESNSISHNNDQLTYAFIDAQNLHQSSKHWGWKLDYTKFREYLRTEFNATIAYLFMGYIQENQEIYSNLQKQGYILVFRETSEIDEHIKGNCDVELVMQAMLDYNEYEQAVVVTGDGDFTPLIRHLNNNGKLKNLLIPNRESFSKWLTKTAKGKMTFINMLKAQLYAPMHSGDTEEMQPSFHNRSRNTPQQDRPARIQPSSPILTVSDKVESDLPSLSKIEHPRLNPRSGRERRNQPTVIKFYNTETSREISPIHAQEPVVELPVIVPNIMQETPETPVPKKTPRPRIRSPRVKKDTLEPETTEIKKSELDTDLSKPIKAVSIHL